MKKVNQRPIAIDLFAGAGGMSLGFEQAGFDVRIAVELDPIHCCTHEYNFPHTKIICQSVTDVKSAEIKGILGNGEIDVIFGGPPCQGFSLIGKRVLEDDRNSLVFHFLRLVLELKPKYFVMENVPGMATGKSQQLLLEVIAKFQQGGYDVVENYQILNAANYGVPQNRKRLFLLGCRQGLLLPEYPEIITKPVPNKATIFDLNLPDTPTVWDAIQDLPEIEKYPELEARDWLKIELESPKNRYAKYLRGLEKIDDDYTYPRKYPNLLTGSLITKHSPESIKRFALTPPGKTEPISRFYRLDPDGLCNTLRAGTASNHGAHTSPRPLHPYRARCITVREAARLHSFPDWFRFHATKWHGFRQIGNSVPPLLAKAVATEIIKVLQVSPSKPDTMIKLEADHLLTVDMSEAAAYYGVDSHVIEPRRIRI